ncbi:HupE/UreJ family protein [Rhodophyticola sp. CCM32]|uniref:HupE/UreJ family protein n=1 Tax=Rhodophyticola sp. CCM32 TaxID=2916397 RepID=UPI001EE545C8|nr:HupE/UreJ family protein [Rhodophyticola sp. CCM32]
MAWLLTSISGGAAHEIRAAVADVEVTTEDVRISIRLSLEPLIAGINLDGLVNTNESPEAAFHDQLRAEEPAELEDALRENWDRISDGIVIETGGELLHPEIVGVTIHEVGNVELPRDSVLVLQAHLPRGMDPVQIGWDASYGELVLRQVGGGDAAYTGFLIGGAMSEPLPRAEILTEDAGAVFLRYILAGFEHIIPLGLDHILFVLGLFFFSLHIRPLLYQVTAFTIAHTITLALASLGIVSIPPGVVEPLIAASIVYVGVENALGWGNVGGRTALVFGFGLLHGLGFASVLGDFGIASGRFGVALLGFNVGVELGQLAVIAIAFLIVGLWFGKKDFYRPFIAVPASVAIAAIGAYWVVERTLL